MSIFRCYWKFFPLKCIGINRRYFRYNGGPNFFNKIIEMLDIFGIIWFSIGNLLVFNQSTCQKNAPIIYFVSISKLFDEYISAYDWLRCFVCSVHSVGVFRVHGQVIHKSIFVFLPRYSRFTSSARRKHKPGTTNNATKYRLEDLVGVVWMSWDAILWMETQFHQQKA